MATAKRGEHQRDEPGDDAGRPRDDPDAPGADVDDTTSPEVNEPNEPA